MSKYVVEQEAGDGRPSVSHGSFEGLAVAKAVARKIAEETRKPAIVRDVASGEALSRSEPPVKVEEADQTPSLAHSVRRLRAANDELKKALVPLAERGKKG
jgi:hypothetical protein